MKKLEKYPKGHFVGMWMGILFLISSKINKSKSMKK